MSRIRILIPVLVGVAVIAAACSSSGDSSSGGDSREPAVVEGDPVGAEVAAEPSAGCDATPVVTPGEEEVTTTSGGDERWYLRQVPPAYDGTDPLPVVFDFHGYSEGARIHATHSELGPYGDEQGFVTITPQGQGDIARWDTELGSTDLVFAGDLFDQVGETLCVDENRFYVTGLSNGAFMTSAIACVYADRIAAVAPVAGISAIDGCDPSEAVPVVAFHGTGDDFVAYAGGLGEAALDLPAPDGSGQTLRDIGVADSAEAQGPSVPEITAAWAERNDCDPDPTETIVADDVTLIEYECPGAPVQLYRVTDGGHTWPGSAFSAGIEAVVGPTTMSISANEVMWEFFVAHPRQAS